MIIAMGNITEGFFAGEDRCKYDQRSISERSDLRNAVKRTSHASNCRKKNALFTSLLKIDKYQDLNQLDDVLKSLQSLMRNEDSKIDSEVCKHLKRWLDLIKREKEEKDTDILVKLTLLESASKTYATEPIERFFPIVKFIVFSSLSIGEVYLTLTQPASNFIAIDNLNNVSFYNITSNDSILISINLFKITLGPIFEINKTNVISYLNATMFDLTEKVCGISINKPLIITSFLTEIVISVLDFLYNVAHHIAYYIFLLFGTNIESIPNSINDLLAQESKKIQNIEERKTFIKIIGNYIGDKLKKTWSQKSFVKDVTNLIYQNVKNYQQEV